MKSRILFIITAGAASTLAWSALAQDTRPDSTRPPRDRQQITRTERLNGAAKSSDVLGMTVKNYQNERLGKVEELAVDVESGRLVQVILSTGGVAGIGDTLLAVPPGALHHDIAQQVLHLDADKERLKNAPKFEMSKWAECCEADRLAAVYRYYNQEPADKFIRKGEGANNPSTRRADGTWVSNENQSMIPASRLSQIQKASKLMGTPVSNLQDQKLGKVENLVVDLPSGRIVAVIIASGGFLGMGDELSAVPPTALRFNAQRDVLQLDASKETMSSAPHFKANQWPDFGQPGYAGGVYRAYKVEPYFSTEPDNTARNTRDRDDQTLTPFDQGNTPADLNTSARIRKEIMAASDLSVNARNVKIITIQGRVTLRGPVNSEQEKRALGEIAGRIARAGNVDNQLEVKPASTAN
jgi:sporulation protein YlmC with PRC-barrel domain